MIYSKSWIMNITIAIHIAWEYIDMFILQVFNSVQPGQIRSAVRRSRYICCGLLLQTQWKPSSTGKTWWVCLLEKRRTPARKPKTTTILTNQWYAHLIWVFFPMLDCKSSDIGWPTTLIDSRMGHSIHATIQVNILTFYEYFYVGWYISSTAGYLDGTSG